MVWSSTCSYTIHILFNLEKEGLDFETIYSNLTQNGYFTALRKLKNKIDLFMKKILLVLILLPALSNCGQYSAMVGPSFTLANTGSVLQATTSLSSSLVMNSAKQNFVHEVKSDNICPTVHSSKLNEIFFETIEQMDCYYDPMSIYR